MKKTYITPASMTVRLGLRSAMMSISADDTLEGTHFVAGGTGTNDRFSGDAKGVTDVNVWDEEW